jgi:hypothetical protein
MTLGCTSHLVPFAAAVVQRLESLAVYIHHLKVQLHEAQGYKASTEFILIMLGTHSFIWRLVEKNDTLQHTRPFSSHFWKVNPYKQACKAYNRHNEVHRRKSCQQTCKSRWQLSKTSTADLPKSPLHVTLSFPSLPATLSSAALTLS